MSDVLYMSLAVGLSVAGAILSAIGYVMQKKGHIAVIDANEIHEIQDEDTSSFWSNKLWAAGFFVYVIGSLLTAAALKFGAQSVLAPLGALVLVCNAVFATKFLNEPFHRSNLYGIILVIIGSIMAVVFGPKSNSTPVTLDYIASCWRSVQFLIFFIWMSALLSLDYFVTKLVERKNYKSMDNHKITHGSNFLMISYIAIAAYFGSTNVLFMKSAVIIIGSFELSYFIHYLFYVTIFGIVLVNILLENFRQKALVYFDARYVVPIYQVLLILGSALMGAIFFNEFAGMSILQLVAFGIAIFITLLGVAILAYDVGSAYKKIMKKLDDKTPKAIHFTKQRNLSQRAKARMSFVKRTHREKTITDMAATAWGGPANYLAAQYYATSMRFMLNDTLRDVEQAHDAAAHTQVKDNEYDKVKSVEIETHNNGNNNGKTKENNDEILNGLTVKLKVDDNTENDNVNNGNNNDMDENDNDNVEYHVDNDRFIE
eukprot:40702_1